MKYGARKPSMKKSISARTKGRATRAVKRATTPFYGKKGVGWIKNPRKAAYNKVYHATTFSIFSLFSGRKRKKKDGPIVTLIADIIFFFILCGFLQLIFPSLKTILSYIIGIPVIALIVYLCVVYFSAKLNEAPINETTTGNSPAEEQVLKVTAEIPDDSRFYLGDYSDSTWLIALGNEKATIIDMGTGEVISYNRVPDITNSFKLEQGDDSYTFVITENEDCLIMGQYDFDRIEKKDLEDMMGFIEK